MPVVSIDINDDLYRKLAEAASNEHLTPAEWIVSRLPQMLSFIKESNWPAGWEDTLGSLADTDLERPKQPRWEDDAPRETL